MQSQFWKGFEKTANVLGFATKAVSGLGSMVMRNKGKALGAGLTALTLGSDAKAGAQMAARGKNIGRAFNVGPTI